MKKTFLFSLMVILCILSCSKDFQGINYKFERAAGGLEKASHIQRFGSPGISLTQNTGGYIGPEEAIIACSRIIFPAQDDAQAIFDSLGSTTADMQEIPVSETKYRDYLSRAIVAYNAPTDNPLVVSIDNAQMMYLDTLDITDEGRWWGMMLQAVYYEFVFTDFRMRWYANNSGPYRAQDVLLKRDGENNWKFVYNHCALDTTGGTRSETYTLFLSDTRQENLFFWEFGNAGIAPMSDTLTHIAYMFSRDREFHLNTDGATLFITFGKTSTEQAGGGFGRLDDQIIGFSISVIYNLDPNCASGTYGLMYNFDSAQEGVVRFSDLQQTTSLPKQLRPIKSIEFEVEYAISEFVPGE
ncbi:MAG: hypothetical protein WC372_04550 [Candidatus Neomarinimicrobiota bacterium]|jgi:hypothetical protein|nr:hypothetical protein [Candidatus Neomarinimicrobiota bacterium]MDX9780820.1 hypothetical protein [bacterium]